MTKILKPSRRGFITGAVSLLVAPAIVRIENLMPVKAMQLSPMEILNRMSWGDLFLTDYEFYQGAQWTKMQIEILYGRMKITKIPMSEIYINETH